MYRGPTQYETVGTDVSSDSSRLVFLSRTCLGVASGFRPCPTLGVGEPLLPPCKSVFTLYQKSASHMRMRSIYNTQHNNY